MASEIVEKGKRVTEIVLADKKLRNISFWGVGGFAVGLLTGNAFPLAATLASMSAGLNFGRNKLKTVAIAATTGAAAHLVISAGSISTAVLGGATSGVCAGLALLVREKFKREVAADGMARAPREVDAIVEDVK